MDQGGTRRIVDAVVAAFAIGALFVVSIQAGFFNAFEVSTRAILVTVAALSGVRFWAVDTCSGTKSPTAPGCVWWGGGRR